MPNWVRNRMRISGDPAVINELLNKCKTKDTCFSFNGIIPMPENVYRGDLGVEEMKKYPNDLNWYDWSVNHWGTKWDATDPDIYWICPDEVSIIFDTAWSAPYPVYSKLDEEYGEELFISIEYADEDLGNNCGIIENGFDLDVNDPLHFAADIWSISDEELKNFDYDEEE